MPSISLKSNNENLEFSNPTKKIHIHIYIYIDYKNFKI